MRNQAGSCFRSAAALLLVALSGCSSGTPTSTTERVNQFVISDQFHSGGTAGFLWLPPMVSPPPHLGGLLANVPCTVRIDETNNDGSTRRTLATFTRTSGPEHEHIRFYPAASTDGDDDDHDSDTAGYYLARWDTDDLKLSTAAKYRVHVLIPAKGGGTRDLGFADIALVRNQQEYRTVNTDNYTPLVNGRDLRIKFRIDRPAVDADGDGVFDWLDNCPSVANPDQKNSVGNGLGDACRCLAVVCKASDQCHVAGTCAMTTGECSNPSATDGASCSLANAGTATCQSGACTIGACAARYADCDGNPANAWATYSDGQLRNVTNEVNWTSSDPSIASVDNFWVGPGWLRAHPGGVAYGNNQGMVTITARIDGRYATAQLTVTPAVLNTMVITPANPKVAKGTTMQFRATGTYSDGTTYDLSHACLWISSDSSKLLVSNVWSSDGLATAVGEGSVTLTAAYGLLTASTNVTITAAALNKLVVTPAVGSASLGLTQQFTATGTFTDASTQDLTTQVTWTAAPSSVAIISNTPGSKGLASTVGLGAATITARFAGMSGTATFNVVQ